jgi:hypothetical protein
VDGISTPQSRARSLVKDPPRGSPHLTAADGCLHASATHVRDDLEMSRAQRSQRAWPADSANCPTVPQPSRDGGQQRHILCSWPFSARAAGIVHSAFLRLSVSRSD